MKRALLSGVAGLLLFALHTPVQATTTSFSSSISGTLFSVDPLLSPFFSVGNPFNYSVTFTYDPTLLAVSSPPAPTATQVVYSGGSVVGAGAIFGSTTYAFNTFTTMTGQTLSVNNDVPPTFGSGIVDAVFVLAGFNGFAIPGFTRNGIQLRLVDLDEVAIANTSVPDLAAYNLLVENRVIRMRFLDLLGGTHDVFGIGVETPLPPALLLFLTGLGVMGFLAKRKSRKVALAT